MIAYVLFLAGLAALACSPTQNPPANTTLPPPKKPEDEPLGEDFGDDGTARERYLKLKALGIWDNQMDLGCSVFQYFEDGSTKIKVLGKGDRKPLQTCEVDEFILGHYADPKIRPLAEAITDGPVPWALDDYDDKTGDDAELRAKIQKVINHLDTLLKKKGLQKGAVIYQEGMGLGLMAYIATPPGGFKILEEKLLPGSMQAQFLQRAEEKLKKEMVERGLNEFWEKLEKNGGIRPKFGNYDNEFTALEAFRNNEAECTELSKILYGACRMAGLDPSFNFVDFWRSEEPLVGTVLRESPDFFHVNIALRLGEGIREFDPTHLVPPNNQNGPLSLSLRQYLSLDLNNRATILKRKKEFSQGEKILIQALRFDPSSILIQAALSDIWVKNHEPLKAIEMTNHSIQLNPRSAISHLIKAFALEQLEKSEEALKEYNKAISLNLNHYLFYLARSSLFFKMQKERDGERDMVIALQLAPENAGKELLKLFIESLTEKHKSPDSIQQKKWNLVEKETQLNLVKCETIFTLASLYWWAGQREYALAIIKGFVQEFTPIRKKMTEKKKEFSPEVLDYLKTLKEALPPPAWEDYEIKPLWDSLNLPI